MATDFSWTGLKGNGTSNFILGSATPAASNFQASEQVKWFGTARARLGWLPTNNLLLYGTGGLAYGRYSATAVLNSQFNANLASGPPFFEYNCVPAAGCFSGSTSRTSAGWTLGAGGEFVLTNHITLKAEYLYVNLGRIGVIRRSHHTYRTAGAAVFVHGKFQHGELQYRSRRSDYKF